MDDLEARGRPFSVTSAGKFALLHTFAAGTNKKYRNGNLPGSLVQGPDGKIYGDTLFGGIGGCNGCCGNGVLYRVNKRNCMVSDCKQLPFDVAPGRAGSFFSAA